MYIDVHEYRKNQDPRMHDHLISKGKLEMSIGLLNEEPDAFRDFIDYCELACCKLPTSAKMNMIYSIIEKRIVPISGSYAIGMYNYVHYGNNCYINSCFQMLAGCSRLVNALRIESQNSTNVNLTEFYNTLSDAYSQLPLHAHLPNIIASKLGFDPNYNGFAEDFMKSLLNYLCKISSTADVLYWDMEQLFVPKKLKSKTFIEVINKLNPMYLIVNVSDYNVVCNINSTCIESHVLCTPKSTYICRSIIVNMSDHFLLMTLYDVNKTIVINDDLQPRHVQGETRSFTRNPQCMACFVRID